MVELPGRQVLEEQVKRYRLLVTKRPRDAAAFAAHQTVARTLYDILVRPNGEWSGGYSKSDRCSGQRRAALLAIRSLDFDACGRAPALRVADVSLK